MASIAGANLAAMILRRTLSVGVSSPSSWLNSRSSSVKRLICSKRARWRVFSAMARSKSACDLRVMDEVLVRDEGDALSARVELELDEVGHDQRA